MPQESAISLRLIFSSMPSSLKVVGIPISLIKSARASTPAFASSSSVLPSLEIPHTLTANCAARLNRCADYKCVCLGKLWRNLVYNIVKYTFTCLRTFSVSGKPCMSLCPTWIISASMPSFSSVFFNSVRTVKVQPFVLGLRLSTMLSYIHLRSY